MGFENGGILIKYFYYPKDFKKPEQEKRTGSLDRQRRN